MPTRIKQSYSLSFLPIPHKVLEVCAYVRLGVGVGVFVCVRVRVRERTLRL